MTPTQPSTVRGYRYQWSLFVDWCEAADVAPLPASPITLALFLDDNPAGDTVQLRRVSAINRAHLDAGHPAPGRVTSLRLALDSARNDRTTRRAAHYREISARLPTSGSTAALFGRRDAILLLLAGAGLSYNAIADLDRGDINPDGGSVWISGHHRLRIDPHDVTGVQPAEVWERWHTVLQFSDRYPSTTLLAEHLQRNTFPDINCRWIVVNSREPGQDATQRPIGLGDVIDALKIKPDTGVCRLGMGDEGPHEVDTADVESKPCQMIRPVPGPASGVQDPSA